MTTNTKKTVSSRILNRLSELLNTRELREATFMLSDSSTSNGTKQPSDVRLFLRRKKRLDYSNKLSASVKLRINSGLGFGRWTYEEHKNFIEGIFVFGNKWKEISKLIKTRNCIQARSHSQKFFFKLFKFADTPDLERYVNLNNLFSFGKEIKDEKLLLLKIFLVKVYEKIENGENVDYFKSNLLVEFLRKLKKSNKNKLYLNKKTNNNNQDKDKDLQAADKGKRRLKLLKRERGFVDAQQPSTNKEVCFEITKVYKKAAPKFSNISTENEDENENPDLIKELSLNLNEDLKSN